MRRVLSHGGFVDLDPEWISAYDARRLEISLCQELAWESRAIVLFGKRIVQPRLVAWAGDIDYRYSGQTLPPRSFGPTLSEVVGRAAAHVGVPFNHVLANRYRDGMDSMGMHSDDEPELGEDPVVCSVSFGGPRRFVLVPRKGRGDRIELTLAAGSLLVMGGTCQRHYRHGIPRDPQAQGERISLTLRHVLRSSHAG
jgi:alkylated DNA repair dioxygenase AlkB